MSHFLPGTEPVPSADLRVPLRKIRGLFSEYFLGHKWQMTGQCFEDESIARQRELKFQRTVIMPLLGNEQNAVHPTRLDDLLRMHPDLAGDIRQGVEIAFVGMLQHVAWRHHIPTDRLFDEGAEHVRRWRGVEALRRDVERVVGATAIDKMAGVQVWEYLENRLPPRHFQALYMYRVQSMTQAEIASSLDISESRVSQLIQNALVRVRAMIEGAPPPEQRKRGPQKSVKDGAREFFRQIGQLVEVKQPVAELQERVKTILDKIDLSSTERKVMYTRYGLDVESGKQVSQVQTAQLLGLSRGHTSRVELDVLARARQLMEGTYVGRGERRVRGSQKPKDGPREFFGKVGLSARGQSDNGTITGMDFRDASAA